MEKFTPTKDYLTIECPCLNGEFMCCNITSSRCPQWRTGGPEDFNDNDTIFPADCPAKQGINISLA